MTFGWLWADETPHAITYKAKVLDLLNIELRLMVLVRSGRLIETSFLTVPGRALRA
jgi:hypothetical protein